MHPSCVQCGSCLPRPSLHTADAGQAYEMVKASVIEDSFSQVFKAIRSSTKQRDPTLSVIHSTKAKAKYGGWISDKLYDRSVLFLSRVAHGMRTLARLKFYKVGNSFLYQRSGIPIDGPVSGAILESTLCMVEHKYDKFRWPVFASKCGLKGTRDSWVTLSRYVDDVLAISFWFCPACLEKLINEIYRDVVAFDKSNDGETTIGCMNGLKFLDLWIFVGWERANIFLVNKNDLFAVSGIGSLLVKNRVPIPQGARSDISSRISCDLKSRLARLASLGCPKTPFTFTCCSILLNCYAWGTHLLF